MDSVKPFVISLTDADTTKETWIGGKASKLAKLKRWGTPYQTVFA